MVVKLSATREDEGLSLADVRREADNAAAEVERRLANQIKGQAVASSVGIAQLCAENASLRREVQRISDALEKLGRR